MKQCLKSIIGFFGVSFLAIGCANHPVSQLHVEANYLTSEENFLKGLRTPLTEFSSKDVVIYFVDLRWDDATKSFGGHDVTWNWYSGSKLISTAHRGTGFNHSPIELPSSRAASSLGKGHFKAELLVDKTPV